jgi:L-amino acid N-acyltransferase YncA
MHYTFEDMAEKHREAVVDIYNYFIEHTYAAYPDETFGYEIFDYFLKISSGYPAVAVGDGSGRIVGFAFLSSFHSVETFRKTAAISYFILPEHTRKGVGRAILERFEQACRLIGVEIILAHVSSLNTGSLMFHEANGFEECGRLRDVGTKFGRDFDVVWFQKRLVPTAATR